MTNFTDGIFLYEFMYDKQNTLMVVEIDTKRDHRLLLLRQETMDLPSLLRERHSHWYSKEYHSILVRSVFFTEQNFSYLLHTSTIYGIPIKYQCLNLDIIFKKLLECEQLLLGLASLKSILASFEFEEYIHIFLNSRGDTIQYILPCFRLSFAQGAFGFDSNEFKGFLMADKQVLEDTLPGLQLLVILRHNDGHEIILIPDGKVSGAAEIEVPQQVAAAVNYHIYDVHG